MPDVGEDEKHLVSEREGEWHVLFSVDAGIAEHHALVPGALVERLGADYAAVDVRALLVDGGDDAAGGGIEAVFGLGVADLPYDAACYCRDVHVGVFAAHFTAHDHEACGAESLARDFGLLVLAEEFIEDCI